MVLYVSIIQVGNEQITDEGSSDDEEARLREQLKESIKHFIKLYDNHFGGLQKNIDELRDIAKEVDYFHKNVTIAKITGGAASAAGGIATIAGLVLAPFTMGTSVVISGVAMTLKMAGEITSAAATFSDNVNSTEKQKRVEQIIESYEKNFQLIAECVQNIYTCINLIYSKFMKKKAFKKKDEGNCSGLYKLLESRKLKEFLPSAVRVTRLAKGLLSIFSLGLDVYDITTNTIELQNGAKTELGAETRKVADEWQCELQELKNIKEECLKIISSNPDS
ncbi:apolipoprotein L6-like [Erpetoichthys calabaricus]|uniref:apolipoprotein L6-like n=1 Tax=Erpetoichthys calabaricus TaxID=27687 RepID=UPI00109EF3C0|nr:apolipoprotein L6-like [Erpetoichthys calabaricus]